MAGVETPLPGLGEEEQFIEEFEVADGDIPDVDGAMPEGIQMSPEQAEAQT